MAIVGILVPTLAFPYALNMWFLSPILTASSSSSLNGSIQLKKTIIEGKVEQFHFVSNVPFLSMNSTVPSPSKKVRTRGRNSESKRRRKKVKVNDEAKVVPPPPRDPIPPRLQVKLLGIQTLLFISL